MGPGVSPIAWDGPRTEGRGPWTCEGGSRMAVLQAFKPPQDISLEEFDDEDLSEITDDCGIGLNYDSDHYEKDCLMLERSEPPPHPTCTFQDDFQEFEMIDDNEEEEEEGEEENGLDEAPPSPSISPIPSPTPEEAQKHRPTTLYLTVSGTQDSLNNNGGGGGRNPTVPAPQRATWQESLLHNSSSSSSTSHVERSSPGHPCLQDGPSVGTQGSHVEGSRAPAHGPPQPLYDAEGNSPPSIGEDYNMNLIPSLSPLSSAPSSGPASAELPAAPKGPVTALEHQPHSYSPHRSAATESNGARFQQDVVGTGGQGPAPDGHGGRARPSPPSSLTGRDSPPASEAQRHGEAGAGGRCSSEVHAVSPTFDSEGEGGPRSRVPLRQGLPPASSASTSPSSDPGIEADLTSRNSKAFRPGRRHSEDFSSPGSDSDLEGEMEAAFGRGGHHLASNMISSISETELDLSSGGSSSSGRSSHLTNSIEEASSPGSEGELEPDPEPRGVMGLKDALLLDDPVKEEEGMTGHGRLVRRESLRTEELEEDPSAPVHPTAPPHPGPLLELEINPDHSLESLRHSFYLPVGPKREEEEEEDEEDEGNSQYDSESGSESEPDLSEDSDSPWLLSNLVNKMISEGSYPIKCADECFPATHSLSDTISPASDLEPEMPSEALQEESPPLPPPRRHRQSIELVDMETLQSSLRGMEEEKTLPPPPEASERGPFLFMSNATHDIITPVFKGRPLSGCCANVAAPPNNVQPRETPGTVEPDPGPEEDHAVDGDLDSGILEDKDMIDDVRLGRSLCGAELEVSTAQTNRCFTLAYSPEEDEEEEEEEEEDEPPYLRGSPFSEALPFRPSALGLDDSLAYDSIKYTLVVDENTQLELVSLKRCTSVLSDDSELLRACQVADNDLEEAASDFGDGVGAPEGRSASSSSSQDSSPEADLHFSKKFLNIFVNSTSRSSSTESFSLFSCMVNGEEREQSHRAVFRFIPRHDDELELDVDDPILVELEEDDYWYRGYNMRTGERGIFPAFYAHEVVSPTKEVTDLKWNPCWDEHFNVQFLGSVEVPYHQGNGILCAAMQKIATTRKLTVHLRPPATCDLEISLRGIKLSLMVNEYGRDEEFERCSHFFQMKNISFCGCHPRNSCYFGFITKHPVLSRFACHVFVSQESMRHVAECVGRAFQEYYQEHLEFACPTEDIYLE